MIETMPKMTGASRRDDYAWEQALDWLMRTQAAPGDSELLRRRDAWLATSEAHAKAYRKAEKVWRLTGHVPASVPIPAPPIAATAPSTRRRVAKPFVAAALAACMALVLLPNLSHRLKADYCAGTGETRQVTLGDGSTVALDAESAIAVALSPERRAVSLLDGRAYFQVAADRARPFVVTADQMTVTVTGTAFEVRSTSRDMAVEVTSGTVSVATMRDGRHESAVLQAGGRARIARADGALTVDNVPPQQIALWRSGRLVVNGATVAEVIEELRRHYRGLIVLRDQGLASRQVTGVFDLGNPAAALDAVLQPHNGTIRELTPYVLVVSAR